jgi:integrase
MAKRKTQWRKRCDCRDHATCPHPWWLRVKVKGGARQRLNLTELFPNEPVEVAAAKARALARSGRMPATGPTALTVRDVAKAFVAVRGESYYLTGLLDAPVAAANGTTVRLGDKPIDEVTTRDVKHARDLWQKRPKAGPNGLRHFLQTARFFFNWAVKQEYATRTPFLSPQQIALISVPKTKGRSRRLEPGEEARLLEHADAYVADFLTTMLHTGCRPGELRTLQWSEVTPTRIVVLARKAKDREERRIPIRPEVRAILDRRKLGPDGNDLPSDAYVFGDDTGRLVSRERLCERWRTTCASAKVKNLHLHDLRGEFGSRLAEAGVPIHQVRDALGHSNITMTSAYLRARTDSLDEAYQRLGQKSLKLVVNK